METNTATPPRKALGLALAGFLAALAGPPLDLLLLDSPFARATSLPTFILMAGGVGLGIAAVRRDPRRRIKALAGASILLLGLFLYAFFVLFRVPADTGLSTFEKAPDFTLPDQTGAAVCLAEVCRAGPVLLVFYRGHW